MTERSRGGTLRPPASAGLEKKVMGWMVDWVAAAAGLL
jgi:hypothetical protein